MAERGYVARASQRAVAQVKKVGLAIAAPGGFALSYGAAKILTMVPPEAAVGSAGAAALGTVAALAVGARREPGLSRSATNTRIAEKANALGNPDPKVQLRGMNPLREVRTKRNLAKHLKNEERDAKNPGRIMRSLQLPRDGGRGGRG